MFMINSLGKWFSGDSSKEAVIEIQEGQLYIVRPHSPKGYSELIYKDARVSIRRTSTEFNYQLIVTKIFEEGEEELIAEEEGAEDALQNQDEQAFLLDEALEFRVTIRDTGEKVFAWNDLSGSTGDLWEFVCDYNCSSKTVEDFQLAACRAQFERKYKRDGSRATEDELLEFSFVDEPIPAASPLVHASDARSPTLSPSPTSARHKDILASEEEEEDVMASSRSKGKAPAAEIPAKDAASVSTMNTDGRDRLGRVVAELHLYDLGSSAFVQQEQAVEAIVYDLGGFNYWLKVSGSKETWVSRGVEDDLSPVFNFEYLSAIFNVYHNDSAFSWLLRFKDQLTLEEFQQSLMQAMWEHQNQTKWGKIDERSREYVLDAFNDLTLEDADNPDLEQEEEEEELESDDEGLRSEHYDSDEDEDDVVTHDRDGNVNSLLAVGAKHDRSFVVRGNKIGVFKHTPDNHLEFATTISQVKTPKGKLFSPTKVMLHMNDANMVLQNQDNPNAVYRMDLETGKVVDEWKVHDDISINTFAPEDKFAQLTDQQTFLGLSSNAMYRVDPRLAGNKLVESNMKQYATKGIDFTTATTTEKGYIAVGNSKGDVRLFDRLGVVAKTALPALGDAIIGLDVSADGRWVLATCKTYLLLIDAEQHDGKFEGKLGFEKAFPKDQKPKPYRLGLTPPHIAQFTAETKTGLSFTPAKFNTGPDMKETTIVTSTGPFIITWSMKKVLGKQKEPYSIKRYTEDVKADNFRFGSDKGIIVALPNEVDLVRRAALKRPTRESIAPPAFNAAMTPKARRSKGYLTRNDIVDSPY